MDWSTRKYLYWVKFKITGRANAHSQQFYAPNAKVDVSRGSNIRGAIIADSFYATGESSIEFDSGSNIGFNGVIEYPDSISLTKK